MQTFWNLLWIIDVTHPHPQAPQLQQQKQEKKKLLAPFRGLPGVKKKNPPLTSHSTADSWTGHLPLHLNHWFLLGHGSPRSSEFPTVPVRWPVKQCLFFSTGPQQSDIFLTGFSLSLIDFEIICICHTCKSRIKPFHAWFSPYHSFCEVGQIYQNLTHFLQQE